jgi:hypothetical protein
MADRVFFLVKKLYRKLIKLQIILILNISAEQ